MTNQMFKRSFKSIRTAMLAVAMAIGAGGIGIDFGGVFGSGGGGGGEVGRPVAGGPFQARVASAQPAGDLVPVSVRAVTQASEVEQGGRLIVAVEMKHAPKFHTWPAASVELPKELAEFAIRTRIDLERTAKGDVELPGWINAVAGHQYPATKLDKVPDPSGAAEPVSAPLYSGTAVTYLGFDVSPSAAVGAQSLKLMVSFQACNESTCFPPEDVALVVSVNVVSKGAAGSATSGAKLNEPALFQGFTGLQSVKTATTVATENRQVSPAAPTASTTSGGADAVFLGMNLGSSVVLLALFSILGGFLLNLTPCVLPVIPIKVLTLTQHATQAAADGKRGHSALALGLFMALGVVAFWTVIGIPMAFVSAALDPSKYIFGVWWVTLGLGMIIVLLGLGIMGLFNFNLPQSVYMVNTSAHSPGGSFMFGVLTAVLGLPCFGFVAGGLLAGASVLPAATIMVIFVGIGVGMAFPYLVLSKWPQLLKFIPRTGPISDLVKQVMGLLLIAAAAFFISAGIKALLSDRPYLTGTIGWWAVAFFIALAAVWMIVRVWQVGKSAISKILVPFLGGAMVLGIVLPALSATMEARETHALKMAATRGGASGTLTPGVWLDYTPELFASARASGKSVFMDFTADWCINCKVLKRSVLDREALKKQFADSGVVLVEVDCTSKNAPGWELLGQLKRTGVPTWAVYGPAPSSPVVIDITTPSTQTVLDALKLAGVDLAPPARLPSSGAGGVGAKQTPVTGESAAKR